MSASRAHTVAECGSPGSYCLSGSAPHTICEPLAFHDHGRNFNRGRLKLFGAFAPFCTGHAR